MATLNKYKLEAVAGPFEEVIEIVYDFAKDAGAVGALDVFKADEALVVLKAYAVVETTATSGGSATVSVGKSGDAAGLIGSTAVASITAGACIAGVANLAYSLAADDVVQMSIGTAALTAGKIKFRFHVASK